MVVVAKHLQGCQFAGTLCHVDVHQIIENDECQCACGNDDYHHHAVQIFNNISEIVGVVLTKGSTHNGFIFRQFGGNTVLILLALCVQ